MFGLGFINDCFPAKQYEIEYIMEYENKPNHHAELLIKKTWAYYRSGHVVGKKRWQGTGLATKAEVVPVPIVIIFCVCNIL